MRPMASQVDVGAPLPADVRASVGKMDFSGSKYLSAAFDKLDAEDQGSGKGTITRERAIRWLRCAGWCLTDVQLNAMLDAGGPAHAQVADSRAYDAASPRAFGAAMPRGGSGSAARPAQFLRKTRWSFKELRSLGSGAENSSAEHLEAALKRLAGGEASTGGGSKISRDRLRTLLAVPEMGVDENEFDVLCEVIGIGTKNAIDCSTLAENLLYRICRPPSADMLKHKKIGMH